MSDPKISKIKANAAAAKAAEDAAAPKVAKPAPTANKPAKAPQKKSNKNIIIIAVLALAIIGGGAFAFLSGMFDAEKGNGTLTTAEAVIKRKFVSANIFITNNNNFVLRTPTLKCDVLDRKHKVIQTIEKDIDKNIDPLSNLKLDNYPLGTESNSPKEVICSVIRFK